jgi:hypothetical protein
MAIVLNGTTGITNDGGYTGDGVVFADTTPANTLVTDTNGYVGIGTSSPGAKVMLYQTNGTSISLNNASTGTGSSTGFQLQTGASTDAYVWNFSNGPHIFATNNTERGRFDSSGNFQFNSGYGSVATAYGCRAWVNFNGTGTVAIRASGNVSSITDNGTGDYTVNLTTAMPDANYCVQGTSGRTTSDVAALTLWQRFDQSSTSAVRVNSTYSTSNNQGLADFEALSVAIFR